MNNKKTIKALQTGLEQALDIIRYYTEIEYKDCGKIDPLVENQVEALKKLIIYSNYVFEPPKHPVYDN
jgi:hypothetical protein